jgi:hypothetical protein
MGNWQNVYLPPPEGRNQGQFATLPNSLLTRWHYIGQFWIGIAAWPALYQYFDLPKPEALPPFWNRFQRTPDEPEVNNFLVNSDKTPDLGWVYTVVAGMLNILVIYDAYAGPVFSSANRSTPRPSTLGEVKKEGVA